MMPVADVRGVKLNYEVVGDNGPWVALSPGGRRAGSEVAGLARLIADAGYRVLLHDRRNCGASEVSIGGEVSEYEVWADDLAELLRQLGGTPAFVGGASSGCRLSLLVAMRHPEVVRGLLLWRVTGGEYAAKRLAFNYYEQFIEMAQSGGMAAVCESEHFAEMIAANASNRERLMNMAPGDFIAAMEAWKRYFLEGADLPVIGAREEDLVRLTMPACILPGHDQTHPEPVARTLDSILPNSEMHDSLTAAEVEAQRAAGNEIIYERDEAVAPIFVEFMARVAGAVRA
jgi:pimeloyl-ACP methyl ester carboxylesterase